LCKDILNHTKFLHLNSIHSSVYIGMRFHLYIFFTMFCACSFFLLCLFDLQLMFFNTFQKVINWVGWLDDRHGPSPTYVTQRPSWFTLISYCALVFSFALMFAHSWFTQCDGFLWCFCLLAESYETTNHYQTLCICSTTDAGTNQDRKQGGNREIAPPIPKFSKHA